jgi:short-subunit dehydrogenase
MKALITGASSGIGRDIARYLSKLGYDLVIVARRKENLEILKKELNTNVEIVCLDVSEKENCIKLFEEHKDIDILVNNAGFGLFGHFDSTDLEKELSMIDTNVVAVHILTKLYVQEMEKRDSGYILNVASIAGFMAGPLMATYYATKNYVVSLSRAIRKELKKEKSNVKISVLCPGPVKTEFNDVAGVRFCIRGVTSKYVAKYAIDKMLKGKEIILPSFTIKCVKFLSKISPDNLVTEVSYHTQKSKDKKEK